MCVSQLRVGTISHRNTKQVVIAWPECGHDRLQCYTTHHTYFYYAYSEYLRKILICIRSHGIHTLIGLISKLMNRVFFCEQNTNLSSERVFEYL